MDLRLKFEFTDQEKEDKPDLTKIPGYFDEDVASYRIDNWGMVCRRRGFSGETFSFKLMKWVYNDDADKEMHFGENSSLATKEEVYLSIYKELQRRKNK